MIHTNHRPARIHITHTLRSSLPIGSAGQLAGPVCLSLRRFPIASLRRTGVPARARLLSVAPSGALRAGRGAFCGEPPLGIVCIARRSVSPCVSPALPYFFLAVPPSTPVVFTHTYTSLPLSLCLLLFLKPSLFLSSPPPPSFTCGSVFLSSLSSSLRVRRRGKRLPGRLAFIPSARAVGCFFSPLCPCILPRRESAATAAAAASFAAILLPRETSIFLRARRKKHENAEGPRARSPRTRMSVLNVCIISSELSRRSEAKSESSADHCRSRSLNPLRK